VSVGGVIIEKGQMDSGKQFMTVMGHDTAIDGLQQIFNLVKWGGSRPQSDLAGTWFLHSFSDSTLSNDPCWVRSTLTLDSTGSVTGGSGVNCLGTAVTVTGGALNMDTFTSGIGRIFGTVGLSIGGTPITSFVQEAHLVSGKKVVTGVFTTSDNRRGIAVLVKQSLNAVPANGKLFSNPNPNLNIGTYLDFDEDKKTDIAVWRSGSGIWFIKRSLLGDTSVQWGAASLGDIPVPGDYDNDGKTDIAVWRSGSGIWFIKRSLLGDTSVQWGSASLGDLPVEKAISDIPGT